jgi:chromosomal replication initiator protein
MISQEKAIEFTKKLREKLLSLGYPADTADMIARKIELQNFNDQTILAHCADPFFKEMFLDRTFNDICSVVKDVWGSSTKLVFSSEKEQAIKKERLIPKSEKEETSIFSFQDQEKPIIAPKTAMVKNPGKTEPEMASAMPVQQVSQPSEHGLQPEFSFSTFVKGPSNSIAFSACESVALQPGKLSNPVFIYGGSGLGKTHLLHAVGNEILRKNPSWNVLYLSSSDFVSHFVTSIRHNAGNAFRDRFLNCDILLVDDVQFLENKDATQIEFFHIFNVLCSRRKQIVLTSDKYPKDIPTLEERLRSRFLQGLLADIEPPSFEERVAIIDATANSISLRISRELTELIATHVKTNIRELKGTLNNLLIRQTVSGKNSTQDDVAAVLRGIVKLQRPTLDILTIQKAVASFYNIKITDLTSSSKVQKLVIPRHVAMYLSRELTGANLMDIASNFGRKDHTTVLNAIENVKKLLERDASHRSMINELKRRLEQMN